MAQTTNFTYSGDDGSTLTSITSNKAKAWVATARTALNDCTTTDGVWYVDVMGNSNGNSVSYWAQTPTCGVALTPTFAKMSTATAGASN